MRTSARIDAQIGSHLRDYLKAADIPPERVAAEARALGLPWSRETLKGLFAGKRRLNVGELLLLCQLIANAGGSERPLPLRDLLPTDQPIDVGGLLVQPEALWGLLQGEPVRPVDVQAVADPARLKGLRSRLSSDIVPGLSERTIASLAEGSGATLDDVFREAAGAAERTAAGFWGTIPELIVIASHRKWGHSLTEERDRQVDDPTRETHAYRGHITRAAASKLDEELRTLRHRLLVEIGWDELEASLLSQAASNEDARYVAKRLRTISEFVVVAAQEAGYHLAPTSIDPRYPLEVSFVPEGSSPTEVKTRGTRRAAGPARRERLNAFAKEIAPSIPRG